MGEGDQLQQDRTRRSFLWGTVGLSLVGTGAVVYDRMERRPNWEPVGVKVGSDSNSVDLNETVSVSMLSSKENDFRPVEEIDLTSAGVRFAIYRGSFHPDHSALFESGASPLHGNGHVEDVNGDGIDDLTFHFNACDAFVEDEITEGDMEGRLLIREEWSFTEEKEGWRGDNPVRIVGEECN